MPSVVCQQSACGMKRDDHLVMELMSKVWVVRLAALLVPAPNRS